MNIRFKIRDTHNKIYMLHCINTVLKFYYDILCAGFKVKNKKINQL